ncbi:short-chain dehydrogenase/reductase SDR [Nitzschia inconspicua]|uniref:Short-chain dehydrogenase/reductase SDR n=1 Tax=Nitzschia inconspicua TaxID=303405 RepID=A0A9K3LI92_9STRA|nr:short-chain dehydrogenase/reductase SDR [Nitzschia inconspicua]
MLERSRSDKSPLTFVVTGCNSGIGLQACKLIHSLSPKSRIFMVARNQEKADQAVKDVSDFVTTVPFFEKSLVPVVCDHSKLRSVRQCCAVIKGHLQKESDVVGHSVGIDVLCLNAAIFLGDDSEPQYTEDNLELTIQTNHFAPFLIANELLEWINPGARVVVTTSGLHAVPGTSFGNFQGVLDQESGKPRTGFEMLDGAPYHHKQCYALSKLCNVAFCLELNRRLQERGAKAVCFTPGLIPTSGLFRHQKLWHETCLKKQVAGIVETEEWGGILLAWMATSDEAVEVGGLYWRAPFGISNRGGKIPDDLYPAPVNEEANDLSNQQKLWEISRFLTSASCPTISSIVG